MREKNWLEVGSDPGEKEKKDRERQFFAKKIRKR